MKVFKQSYNGGLKSQLTALLRLLRILKALSKSSSNVQLVWQIILAKSKLKASSFFQQFLAMADLLVS